MIRRWREAGWFTRGLALVCLFIIIDSATTIGALFFADVPDGDALDRYTAVRVVRKEKQAAIIYRYWHSNSSTQLTAIHLSDKAAPAVGTVIYRNPGGQQVLLADVEPAKIDVQWSGAGKPTARLASNVQREGDWVLRERCLVKKSGPGRVCWNAAYIDVD